MPVNTMAMPYWSAALITSSSFIEPPGWMTAVMPCLPAMSILSMNGKKASEAMTAPFTSSPASPAFITAMRVESIRDIWPAPMPIVIRPFASTMALLLTCLQTFHAKSMSSSSLSFGARLVAVFKSAALPRSGVWSRNPPETFFTSKQHEPSPISPALFLPVAMMRRFFLADNSSSTSLSKPGAMIATRKILDTASATSMVTTLLNPTTPPKADVLSHE